jgi:hypothetical protein
VGYEHRKFSSIAKPARLDAVSALVGTNSRVFHKGCTAKGNLSLERIHCFCFNRSVNPVPHSPVSPSQPTILGKVVEFADLRLSTPMKGQPVVLFEYEDRHGVRSIHQVALTCTGQGHGGLIYFGGYDKGKFSIFRADCIHRVVTL